MAMRAYLELRPLPRRTDAPADPVAGGASWRWSRTWTPTRSSACGARRRTAAGLILAVGHVGSNEAVAAAIARHGMPISVVADDSAFPELFELLRRQREAWGVTLIAWRNLRAIFGVLRRREMLGLLVDWGYRADGIPVRLFGALDALPAGPGDPRGEDRLAHPADHHPAPARRHVPRDLARPDRPRVVDDPAELQRATQAIADALASTIAAAPEQWYSFKPIWPATPEEAADLERRATLMQAGIADPGPGAGVRLTVRGRSAGWARLRLLLAASWLACRLPERLLVAAGRVRRRPVVSRHARPRGPGPTEPAAGGAGPRAPRARHGRWPGRRRTTRVRSSGSCGSPTATPRGTTSRSLRTPALRPGDVDELMFIETPDVVADAFAPGAPSIFVGLHFGAIELPAILLASHVGGAGRADGDDRRSRPAGLVRAHARSRRRAHRRACARRGASSGGAAGRDERRARRRPRPDRRRHPDRAVRGAGPAPARARHARRRERRAAVRGRRPADRDRPLSRPAGAGDVPADGQPPRARDRGDGRHRPRVRAHRGGRAGAVVGRVLPDLAGPGGRGRVHGDAGTAAADGPTAAADAP